MTGAFLNALGILFGSLFGLARPAPLSPRTQDFFRRALGAATVFFGFRLVWAGVNGTVWSCTKQIFIVCLAVTIGNWLGKLLHLQGLSNKLGRFAGKLIASAQTKAPPPATHGLIACSILFCAAPLGLLGAVTDGLARDYDFYLLAVKAVMDGLAMAGFVRLFGWPSAFSAFPVYALLGAITFACQNYARPFLEAHGLAGSVNIASGFLACVVALVILAVRKVELANFLPALVVAPALMRFLG